MCGIAGYAGRVSRDRLMQAHQCQAHRGPDGDGVWFRASGDIAFSHRRLSILDVSPAGAQPMAAEDGSATIIFNGEIYNFRELREELIAGGWPIKSRSDTEVLLALYHLHGERMLPMLNGIFAFAIWNERTGEMFVARDALGVKPLYYAETSDGTAFASELKGVLALVPDARELDPESINRYLTFLWCPGDGTPLKRVRKLGPGRAMMIRDGRMARQWQWYRLPQFDGRTGDLDREASIRGTVDGLRLAVKRQLVSDVPVGAFLSGGLDSSAVVAFAREQAPGIRCFTIETEGGQEPGMEDDLPYARRVAAHLKVPLEIVRIEASRMATDFRCMVDRLDEPLADPAVWNVYYISTLARQHGIKVLLSGVGGDDLFTGYRRHTALNYQHYWALLPDSLRSRLRAVAGSLDQRKSRGRRAAKFLSGTSRSGDAHLISYFEWSAEDDLRSLYTPAVRAELRQTADGPMLDFLRDLPGTVPPLERLLALEQRFFVTDHNLNYTDKMSMAAGVEVRVPFLDVDLVAHAARIPPRFKQHGRTGKWVLKKAMEPYLPYDIIHRSKASFGAPLRRWIRQELRADLRDALSSESLRRRGLFEPAAVQRLMAHNDSGRSDAAYTLLSLMVIELWCRRFIDGA